MWLKDRKLGPFIDGAFKGTSSQLEILKPCTQDVLGTVGQSVVDNINSAVSSALKAADAWTKLSGHERACHLYRYQRLMIRKFYIIEINFLSLMSVFYMSDVFDCMLVHW